MQIKIREAESDDMNAVLSLIKELAAFEKASEEVKVTVQELVHDGFGEKAHFKANVAELNEQIVGMALFYIAYSTWKGKMLYLDDLIVKEEFRSKGIGKKLLESVFEYAHAENARLIKWQVLHWNKDAIRFYKRYNITLDNEWIDCKIYESEILKQVQENKG